MVLHLHAITGPARPRKQPNHHAVTNFLLGQMQYANRPTVTEARSYGGRYVNAAQPAAVVQQIITTAVRNGMLAAGTLTLGTTTDRQNSGDAAATIATAPSTAPRRADGETTHSDESDDWIGESPTPSEVVL